MSDLTQLRWQLADFDALTALQWHHIYAARCAVFILEQNCAYQDIDGKDPHCRHLIAWDGEQVAAYLRLVPAGRSFAEVSLGRVLSSAAWRGSGIGKDLLGRGIAALHAAHPGAAIRIGAQAYLEKFYASFGFETVSAAYLEDDIAHIDMLLPDARDGAA